ncbi:MAG: aspartate carbamoyltransferase [Candidatus Eremiobacteraeota bacterium]|nr:aspartate carbamoyltransferase [Candidatus Eremiobacteraeota bacterium]
METAATGRKKEKGPFKGRSVSVVGDLSLDEQYYLYQKSRELKETLRTGGDTSAFCVDDPLMAIYILFLEDSTRTRESFINAARFHRTKLNIFDADSSSFSKNESYRDTFNMLCGYSPYSVFVMRTKLEGVCRWLDTSVAEFAARHGIEKPAFINSGDGKHEHPTQEFLDEFTFLEHLGWKRGKIRIALIGDLFHGRTIHSKPDGLCIFQEVSVDLVAPEELAMPSYYIEKMEGNGFRVRHFSSIEEYLSQDDVADIWYFTRLQLERMGEKILQKEHQLRQAVTFEKSFLEKYRLPDDTRFYHPLPRNKEYPTIPSFLDETPLNGWESQSINGYYTRTVLLSMLGGATGLDFQGASPEIPSANDDFIEEVTPVEKVKPDYKVGIKPIETGIVIDHIEKGEDEGTIWDHIDRTRKILALNRMSSHGVYRGENDGRFKGIISVPGFLGFGPREMEKLAAVSPECTLNVVKEWKVVRKFRLHMPWRIENFGQTSCKNVDCISHPSHHEYTKPIFHRMLGHVFKCHYCDRLHNFKEIWDL